MREALAAHGSAVSRILVAGKDSKTLAGVVRMAETRGVAVEEATPRQLDQLTRQGRHQGVVAMVPPLHVRSLHELLEELEAADAPQAEPAEATVDTSHEAAETETDADDDGEARPAFRPRVARALGSRRTIVALDEIEDPQNFGAIVRTAVALGAFCVLWPEHHSAPLSPAMVRASAGAVEHARLVRVPGLPEALKTLREQAFLAVGLDANGAQNAGEVDYPDRSIIVVGAEGKGLRRSVKSACDSLVRLPMNGPIASLNASVAAALALYEVVRPR